MAGRDVVAGRQLHALGKVREILTKHHGEAEQRLTVYTPGGVLPNSYKQPDQFDLFLAESVQMLAELLDPILEERKPKKRGRPPKQDEK